MEVTGFEGLVSRRKIGVSQTDTDGGDGMTQGTPVRFGIVGCGVVAPLHADAIRHVPGAELVAVADVDETPAKNFASHWEVPHVYTDYREMLRQDFVDVVCVCTPSGLHGDVVLTAAANQKHVLCEKPLEIRAEKMTEMIDACRTAGVKLGAVYQRRASPLNQRINAVIREGRLGKLVLCDAYLKYHRSQEYYDTAGWRGTWAVDGGGALMNQGVHGVDMIQWLGGGVERVYARTAALVRKIEVEDTAVAVVQFKSGAFGVIEAATSLYPEHRTRFELHGDKGTISFDDSGLIEWNIMNDEQGAPEPDAIELDVRSPGHYVFVRDMAQAVVDNRCPMVPGEEARKAVDIILGIYESARTGREVVLQTK